MKYVVASLALFVAVGAPAFAEDAPKPKKNLGYQDTPLVPGTTWHVHDGERPQPTVVTPGTFSTQDQPGKPPSDAIVLFDGTNLDKWQNQNWKLENGYMEAAKGQQTSKDSFGDIQLHIEWTSPVPGKGEGQGRGNSGVFLMGIYEIQVLDCFENQTYPDGQTAAIYGSFPPLVNANRKPGEWQMYDIIWECPKFDGDKKVVKPAFVTVIHNGIVVHHRTELKGRTNHKAAAAYTPHSATGPISMQDHGNPVKYRNIWVRPLKGYDQP
ncbi:MAG: DUF1080 domain-containing protein [Planctomycetes bacterium]|nr:DUF1080 domain-containing protein [Planctomycetota bacterium]